MTTFLRAFLRAPSIPVGRDDPAHHGHRRLATAPSRLYEIDCAKAVAIVSVLLIHSLPESMLYAALAPFHIWQGMSIFMVLAGVTGALAIRRKGAFSLAGEYSFGRLGRRVKRILLPYTFIWAIEIAFLTASGQNGGPDWLARTYVLGGMGPGSYFIPVLGQHLLLLPVIYWAAMRLKERGLGPLPVLALGFAAAIGMEWLCILLDLPGWLYRLLIVRYLFAIVLGIALVEFKVRLSQLLPLSLLGAAYVGAESYLGWHSSVIYPAWGFRHAPNYFYSALLVVLIWKVASLMGPAARRLGSALGRASFHIFLAQMLYFWKLGGAVRGITGDGIGFALVTLAVCLPAGCLFHAVHERLSRRPGDDIDAPS